jgi:hypothetical protein
MTKKVNKKDTTKDKKEDKKKDKKTGARNRKKPDFRSPSPQATLPFLQFVPSHLYSKRSVRYAHANFVATR